ncbi:hypothetical protein EV193_11211 [Herbihabitans rhizosphaerae]|uniref:Glycosyl hydrolase family 18 (Putative chitinase) n=1 Tax=Herbihabitans rhizosphaerae TaxID=1872711 RepID=A0A4Q7KHN2_9PSEU|nr:hypothetical protein [Herbihabitans rhizosphaerae]RZS32378.1 hypothetical protein EV193_11211 [Herbihabitans rhizosphaerae]
MLVAALHLNDDGTVHLNDHPPGHERYTQMWKDLADMKAAGVRVSVMVGGAAKGTFTNWTGTSTPTARSCAT